jgi:hypothetical protein
MLEEQSRPTTRLMNHRLLDGVLYVRHGSKEPLDSEWQECVDAIDKSLGKNQLLRILVKTDGGGPNVTQLSRKGPGPRAATATRRRRLRHTRRLV